MTVNFSVVYLMRTFIPCHCLCFGEGFFSFLNFPHLWVYIDILIYGGDKMDPESSKGIKFDRRSKGIDETDAIPRFVFPPKVFYMKIK